MRGVVFNFFKTDIKIFQDAFSVRTGLLFCDEVTYCGTGRQVFNLSQDLLSFSFEMKMHLIANDLKIAGRTDAFDAATIYKQYQILNQKKGKVKEEIIWIKHIENYVNNQISAKLNIIENRTGNNALSNLKPFIEKNYFHILSQHLSYPEKVDREEGYIPVSQMLTLEVNYDKDKKKEQDCEDPVFILPHNFLYKKEEEDTKSGEVFIPYIPVFEYAYKLFTLPNINNATVSELEILRRYIQSSFNEFKETADEWLQQVYSDKKNHESFLLNKLIPLSKKMEDEMYEHELIDHYDVLGERKFMSRVMAGVCRLSDIWNFFYSHKAIPEETWIALNKMKEESDLSNSMFPFISFEIPLEDSMETEFEIDQNHQRSNEELKKIKKNLDID